MSRFLCLLLVFFARPLDPAVELTDRWVIWNVGQGLWTTQISRHHCHHVDLGGERFPKKKLRHACRHKLNALFISHWDWDHLGGIKTLESIAPSICLAAAPGGIPKNPRRRRLIEGLQDCPEPPARFLELHWARQNKSSNHASRVWLWDKSWLFPGDSPTSEEKKWSVQLTAKKAKVRTLLAGHHGSRTSTSATLLKSLPHLRVVIVSARRKVYGHPHPLVESRLHRKKIPILRTEEWGHLIFEISKTSRD